MNTLNDKVIVITGAGGAIAGAVEESFRARGARIMLVDRDIVRIQGRAASYNTTPIEADLSDLDNVLGMVEAVKEYNGRIDGLIHLVGEVVTGRVAELDIEAYQHAFDTNMKTLFLTVKAVLPELLQRDEAFIGGIASQEAWGGGAAGSSLFAAAKSAVATFLRSLNQELTNTGVDVAIIFPMGPVDTLTNRRKMPDVRPGNMVAPEAIGEAFAFAAQSGKGARLHEIPLYPPRGPAEDR